MHTFDEETLGLIFLGFLGVIVAFSVTMILLRLPLLKSKNELDSFLSRESSFLLNNLVLLGIAFATFWGTIFPIVSEAFRGVKITVGPPFYNQVNVPHRHGPAGVDRHRTSHRVAAFKLVEPEKEFHNTGPGGGHRRCYFVPARTAHRQIGNLYLHHFHPAASL